MSKYIFSAFCVLFLTTSLWAQSPNKNYFPNENGKWKTTDIAKSNWDTTALTELMQYAQSQSSSGLLILVKGKILVEEYWIENGGNHFDDVAFIQKSVISLLCGKAIAEGLLDINLPVSHYIGRGWSKLTRKQEKKVLVKHLLGMCSGLSKNTSFKCFPEEEWLYNVRAYVNLTRILETITGKAIRVLTQEWLTNPIGIEKSKWTKRKHKINPYAYKTNLRDLGKLGLLTINKGYWKNKNIIGNEAYLQTAFQPSQKSYKAYGYLFWLNIDSSYHPKCPEDMIFMFGKGNKYVFMFPTEDIIVVRLGNNLNKDFPAKFLDLLMETMPKAD